MDISARAFSLPDRPCMRPSNPDHARQQAHRCVWSFIGHALQTLKASILDLPDLITNQPPALHIASQLASVLLVCPQACANL
jgi:hypothetical protein